MNPLTLFTGPYGLVAKWAVILLAIGLMALALKIQTARLHACQDEHAAFVAKTEAIGKAQEDRAKAENARHAKEKDDADKSLSIARADLATAKRRLRESSASGSYLPKPPTNSSSPQRITFDRAKLDAAIRSFDLGVQEIVGSGDDQRVGLDNAKQWGNGISQ